MKNADYLLMTSKESLYRPKSSGHSLIFTELREQKKYTIGWTGTIKRIQGEKEKMRENLNVGEKVLVLAKKKRKKSAPGKFYKQSVQSIAHFNKEKTFVKELNKK